MQGQYDRVFKMVILSWAEYFLGSIFQQKTLVSLQALNVEKTSWSQKREDGFFLAIFSDGTQVYLHIEIQATNDAKMLKRMLRYFSDDYELYDAEPIQYVLYIGEAPPNMETKLGGKKITYEYELIDIRDVSESVYLEQDGFRFWPFACLSGKTEDERNAHLEAIARRILAARLPESQFFEAAETLVALAPLRRAEEAVNKIVRKMSLELKYDIRKAPFYKEGLEEGEAKGEAKGRAEGRAEGAAEKRDEMIRNMAKNGVSIEIIAKTADLDVETVQKIINE